MWEELEGNVVVIVAIVAIVVVVVLEDPVGSYVGYVTPVATVPWQLLVSV